VLVAEGLVKRYGSHRALDGFDLEVAPGEVVGLVGRNGAGKTTFVEVVAGLVRPEAGRLQVAGIDALASPRQVRALAGVAPQELALYPSLTVREHLRLFAALTGLGGRSRRKAVDALTEELGLSEVADRRAGLLSGGQRRRTQAACALVGSPPLLLLDEPTVGADPDTRRALLSSVADRARAGAAVVYTTHYLAELDDLDATLAVVDAGQVVARGHRAELLAHLPSRVRVEFAAQGVGACGQASEVVEASFDPAATITRVLAGGGLPRTIEIQRPTLNDLYQELAASHGR